MIVYIGNPKESGKKLLELIVSKVTGYKINIIKISCVVVFEE